MQALQAKGAIPLCLDITRDEKIEAVVEQIRTEHGVLDVLINNAGFGISGSVEETSLEDTRYQFDVNPFGRARLTQLTMRPVWRRERC